MQSSGPIVSFPSNVTEKQLGSDFKAALVIGHPGHELCVYGWLQLARPRVFVLTDGSGRSGLSRLGSTTRILSEMDAQRGSIYGRFSDQAIYDAMLSANVRVFVKLAEELADEFLREHIQYVVGDSMEGYNPTHDLCRIVLDAAVGIAQQSSGHRIDNFDVFLAKTPDPSSPRTYRDDTIRIELDDRTLADKLAAARAYAELALEVKNSLEEKGLDAFRVECLRPADRHRVEQRFLKVRPFYESYGEGQVAAGYYEKIIRYRDHLLPISEALRDLTVKNQH